MWVCKQLYSVSPNTKCQPIIKVCLSNHKKRYNQFLWVCVNNYMVWKLVIKFRCLIINSENLMFWVCVSTYKVCLPIIKRSLPYYKEWSTYSCESVGKQFLSVATNYAVWQPLIKSSLSNYKEWSNQFSWVSVNNCNERVNLLANQGP